MTIGRRHADLAYDYFRERRIPEALEQFRLGVKAGEDPDAAALERWLTCMLAGEFELAWQESDRVLRARKELGAVCSHLPEHQRWLWDGTPIEDRSVMVRCFHGLGDTIQFIRFLPKLREVCRAVSIEPQAELYELIPPVRASRPEFEIELMEVPHALRVTVENIPARVPYLQVSGARPRSGNKLRVGLAWASGVWRPERSVPLPLFRFLDDFPEIELVSLQRGAAERGAVAEGPAFYEAEWGNDSVGETARIMRSLDLVISTDTMVAHLAGALAIPVWTLLYWDADWRWLDRCDHSPWYPTMRLFRQQQPGDWKDVLLRVKSDLSALTRIQKNFAAASVASRL